MATAPVHEREAGRDEIGSKRLVQGQSLGLRLWEGRPDSDIDDPSLSRDYVASHESVGYVISGKAQLKLEGQLLNLGPGSSWIIPPGASHSYHIVEGPFKAVEAVGKHEEVTSGGGSGGSGAVGGSAFSSGASDSGGAGGWMGSGIGGSQTASSGSAPTSGSAHRYIH